jgi:hypothetical protein
VSGRVLGDTSEVRGKNQGNMLVLRGVERRRERKEPERAKSPRKIIAWVLWLSATCNQRGD